MLVKVGQSGSNFCFLVFVVLLVNLVVHQQIKQFLFAPFQLRFGRSVLHLSQQLAALEAYGVRFIAVSQGVDTDASNPASKLMMTILAGVAEFEREIICERVASGIAQAKRKGVKFGRPAKVFRRDEAVRMRQAGQSYRQIAKALDVPVMTVVDAVRKCVSETGSATVAQATC